MKISFFEEFPDFSLFEKLKNTGLKPRLYLASPELSEYQKMKNYLSEFDTVWWVTLPRWRGYWLSPYTPKRQITRVFKSIKRVEGKIMLDIEFPVLAPWLFVLGFFNRNKNRKFLCEQVEKYRRKIIMCEVPGEALCEIDCGKIWMVYTSLKMKSGEEKKKELARRCREGVRKWGSIFKIGLGCVGKGMFGVEPQLSTEELMRDIKISEECGVEECIIFRLGGVIEKRNMIENIIEFSSEVR